MRRHVTVKIQEPMNRFTETICFVDNSIKFVTFLCLSFSRLSYEMQPPPPPPHLCICNNETLVNFTNSWNSIETRIQIGNVYRSIVIARADYFALKMTSIEIRIILPLKVIYKFHQFASIASYFLVCDFLKLIFSPIEPNQSAVNESECAGAATGD